MLKVKALANRKNAVAVVVVQKIAIAAVKKKSSKNRKIKV
jgi:cation transport regulator ChaB